jgi:MOSC domain-containing protein YiiM
MKIHIEHIFISPDHNYVGHFGGPAGTEPAIAKSAVRLIAGRGIAGDRYALREEGHPKQITFFDIDIVEALSDEFGHRVAPEKVRRNVFLRGVDLPSMVNRTFGINGIRFHGVDDCKPCFWMNEAVAPGAEEFLQGRGGLRARILDDGQLRVGEVDFQVEPST